MKKILFCFLGLSLGLTAYANQYMVVQCNMIGSDSSGKLWPSYYLDPQTGKTLTAASCGEALSKVPANYFLKSSIQQNSNYATYLFSANSGIAPQQ